MDNIVVPCSFDSQCITNMGRRCRGWAGSPSNTKSPGLRPLHTKWHLDACRHLATMEMGRKLGRGKDSASFFGEGRSGFPSNTKSPGLRPSSIPSVILIHAAIAATDMGRTFGGGCAPLGGAGSPSNTMWPGPRLTCMPSFILIRPTVWPQ